jgi:glucokinase
LKLVVEQRYASRDCGSLEEILRAFVSAHDRAADCAAFGIAGPVRQGRVETPNLSWVVEAQSLEQELGLKSVGLINDLEANAYGIATLSEEDFEVLNVGAPAAAGNAAVISAGTGLGEAGLLWDGTRYHPFACEGGHADFSPRSETEIELLRYLLGRFGRVSWERVVSGPGLYRIYEFLRDSGRGEEPPWLAAQIRQKDPSLVVSQHGLRNTARICAEALDHFVSLYGAEAGNLALKMMATGGIYLGGGIAPKIVEKLKGPGFMAAFAAKGRLKSLLADIPVRVILNDKTALFGAARYAALQASLM